ncbi:YbdD/YjiX family protein [Paenalcaligenes sp. Me131]|jgi:uncharacterized short protein YbdD (DUF466 family)|uniref:YbdD/YjiX family protein n=1 Tax=Paenalcaligenes sp. Me131 TaxID=3392636 RepID=UPI003D2A76E7
MKTTGLFSSFARSATQTGAQTGRYLGRTLRLMVGVPDYDVYVKHMQTTHPDQEPMDYATFFKERQAARYGGKGRIMCC